jgi:hypothetical protein
MRIGARERPVSEIAAWQRKRNADSARIKWMFNTEGARGPRLRRTDQRVINHLEAIGPISLRTQLRSSILRVSEPFAPAISIT